jgi:hypothetical protein
VVSLGNIQVIKQRTLQSAYRDHKYPDQMPFYLYGSGDKLFVDHMLLRAPNVQISSIEPVSLRNCQLSDEQLSQGVLAFIDVRERAAQPFTENDLSNIIQEDREYTVQLYHDPHPAHAQGPGLADRSHASQIGSGTLKFNKWPWIWAGVNEGRDPPSISDTGVPIRSVKDLFREYPGIPERQPRAVQADVQMYSLGVSHRSAVDRRHQHAASSADEWATLMSDSLPMFRK